MKSDAKLRGLDPRRSFAVRLTLVMVALVIITLAGVAFITVRTMQSRLTDQVGENFQAQAGSISSVVEVFFIEEVSQLQVVALSDVIEDAVTARNATYTGSSEESLTQIESLDAGWVAAADDGPFIASITDPTRNAAADQLARFLEDFGDHTEVFVTDRYGATVAATGRLSDYYQADEGWWQAGWNDGAGAVYISNPEFDESAGVTALLIAVPILSDETGEVIGVLRSTLDVEELFQLIEETSVGQTGYAMLFDGSGEVLVDPHARGGVASPELAADLRQEFATEVSGFKIASDQNGEKWILGHSVIQPEEVGGGGQRPENQTRAAVANLGWSAVVRQQADEALASVDAIVRGTLVAGLVAVGLASLVGLFVARAITRSLAKLSVAAKEVGAGNLDTPLPAAGGDEIGRLTISFGNMTARLRDLIGSLEGEISERKQMEEALAVKTEEYVAVTNLTRDVIAKVDEEGRWVFLNDAACEFFGKPREELLHTDSRALIHPDDLELSVQAVREAATTREPIEGFVNRQITPMGTRVVEWNASPFFDEEDRYAGIQMTGRDVTERNKAEEALRESEERFRSLSTSAPIGIFLTGVQGKCTYANPRLQAIAGLTLEESLGDGWTKVIHPDDRQAVLDEVFKRACQGRDFSREFRILTPEGELHWIHVHTSPMFSPQGKQKGSVGTVEDITERRQVEEALRTKDSAIESSINGIALADPQGNLTYANSSLLRMWGYDHAEEILGKPVREFWQTKEKAREVGEALRVGGSWIGELVAVRKDGSTFDVQLSTSMATDEVGRPICMIGSFLDITERRRMENALAAKTREYIDTVNLTGDIIAKLDRRGNWVFLNDAACRFYEKPREELLGTDSRAFVHPEDLEATAEAIRETRTKEEFVTGFVNRQVVPMGTRVVEWDGYPLFDEEGQYAGIQITGHNITKRRRMENALAAKTKEYIDTVNLTGDIIARLDKDGRFTFVNDAACQSFGKPREELLGTDAAAFMPPEDFEAASRAVEGVMESKGSLRGFESRLVTPTGTRVVEWNGHLFFDEEGEYAGIQITGHDISERKQMEEALRESEGRYRLLAENTTDLIWTMDLGLRYTYMSPAITRMRGYNVEEVMAQTVNESMTPASREAAVKTLAEELAIEKMEQKDPQRSRTLELEMYCKDGSTIWTEMNMTFLRDSDGRPVGILGVTRDISERKRAEEEQEGLHAELELRAITDSLTGLYDHAHFYQRLAEEIDRSKRYNHGFAIVMMDVDDFKRFNDSRGHQAGDEMLRFVARCIRSGLRRSDLAFRYGGDEFAAILPHAESSKARAAVDRINGRITRALKRMDGDAATRLSLSAGVACFPDDGIAADDLVRIADAALYSAKWVTRARDIMGQREDIESLISALVGRRGGVEGVTSGAIFPPEALHEQQARIVSSVASSIAVALKDAGVAQALEDPDLQVLATVGAAAEIKDRHIRGHPERTSERAAALAEEMGLSADRVKDIRIAGLLHDIGKVTVSEGILNKPGKLTRREFASIRDHPIVGATLVSQVRGFERLMPIVRHHHERFDGKGYPDGLAGEDIPLEARILSVVDVFDAMTHQRSYRKAASREQAIAELERGVGTQFDAAVVKAFLALVKRRGEELTAPAQAARQDRQPVAARAAGRGKR